MHQAILSRSEAKDRGLSRYFTGKPCAQGHTAERWVCSKKCSVCLSEYRRARYRTRSEDPAWRQQRSAYATDWRARHPEKVSSYGEAARHKRPDEVRNWKRANPDRVAIYNRTRQLKMKISSFAHEREEMREAYYTCPPGHHVDHIIPLKHPLVCGLHVLANLQYLPGSENSRKKNKWTHDW